MLRSSIVKNPWWLGSILSSLIIALVLVRVIINQKVTRQFTDQAAMKAAVLHSIPPGSTIAHAEQFMAQEGFQCVRTTNADRAEQERVYHHFDYLYCDRTDSAGLPVTRRWQIALLYENDHITDVLVSTGLVGP